MSNSNPNYGMINNNSININMNNKTKNNSSLYNSYYSSNNSQPYNQIK